MFGEKALELIKELERSQDGVPPFNDDVVKQVLEEMQILYEANFEDAGISDGVINDSYYASVQLRHAALDRNKRCLLAYLYNRLRRIRQARWEFGSILPPEIKSSFSEPEVQWFTAYSKLLATYMRSIGDNHGLNLTTDITPPKSLYIEVPYDQNIINYLNYCHLDSLTKINQFFAQVRCLVDYGKFELEDGEIIFLKKNSQHLLPRAECEGLVRQGVLQHVVS